MSDLEKKVNGIEAVGDDELDAVAVGSGSLADFDYLARQEGRRIKVPADAWACGCPMSEMGGGVYAQSSETVGGVTYYYDVKCYWCQSTKDIYPNK